MNQGGYNQGGYGQDGYQSAASPAPGPSIPQEDDDLPEGFQTIDEDDIPF